ncbi:unnamed protein product [Polarella glacialis]|uniref:Uncharacterized protein n=1 Tax=Polarella glacialis TaxID=89957 RepID=A0A813HRF0_POLGL|nr:unnamed protein product [Polarella glacialis]
MEPLAAQQQQQQQYLEGLKGGLPLDAKLLDALVCSCAVMLLATHAWLRRARLSELSGKCWLLYWHSIGGGGISAASLCKTRQNNNDDDNQRARQSEAFLSRRRAALQSARVSACNCVLGWTCQISCTILILKLYFVVIDGLPGKESMAVLTAAYFIALMSTSGVMEITAVRLDMIAVFLHFLFAAGAFSYSIPAQVLLLSGVRSLIRLLIGLIFLDTKKVMVCNVAISLSNIYMMIGTGAAENAFAQTSVSQDKVHRLVVVCEALSFSFVVGIMFIIRQLFEAQVNVALDTLRTENSLQSKTSLLSVLCDAAVALGPDLKLTRHCQPLAAMLMTSLGPNSQGLAGSLFTNFLCSVDKARFCDFIARSDVNAEAAASNGSCSSPSSAPPQFSPPQSLHVHLCDVAGVKFPVELFHVAVPDFESPVGTLSHLIGIREDGARETSTAWQQFEASAARLGDSQPTGAVANSSQLPLASQLSFSGVRVRDGTASSTSTGSLPSVNQNLPELPMIKSIHLKVDGFGDGFPILEARILFDPHAATEDCPAPCMRDLLRTGSWPQFHKWMHFRINDAVAGCVVSDLPVGLVELRHPGHDDLFVRAASLELREAQGFQEKAELEDLSVRSAAEQAWDKEEQGEHAQGTGSNERQNVQQEVDKAQNDPGEASSDSEDLVLWVDMRDFCHRKLQKRRESQATAALCSIPERR